MTVVAWTVFRTLQFPHLGKIVTIFQLESCSPDVTAPTTNNIPMLGKSPSLYQFIGVGMLKDSTLMAVFPLTPPSTKVATVNKISTTGHIPKGKEVVETSSLGIYKDLYNAIQFVLDEHYDDHHLVALDPYHLPYWLDFPLPTLDYLSQTFP